MDRQQSTINPRDPAALLCDVDGVIRIWDTSVALHLEEANGLSCGTIAGIAFDDEILRQVNTGHISDEQWRAIIQSRLRERCGSDIQASHVLSQWSHASAIDEAVLTILRTLSCVLPVILVTNGTSSTEKELAKLGILDSVSGIINSATVGVAKPDPRIYRYAASLAGIPLGHCLFVDDTPGHVASARRVGMRARRYRSLSDLQAAAQLLLPKTHSESSI